MKVRSELLIAVPIIFLLRAIGSAADAPAAPKEWAEIVRAAEIEKQVNIAGPPGDAFRAAMLDGFKKGVFSKASG